ncbi:unnamed protein product [Lymnaea stagnalis]|uniref:G-protein coupled receptors family 1 profile domain-containing protein n=1 Tax=Lymnaea stagnalis TaxID=6523 RepID=A0AAV2IKW0_LYMST
MDLKEGNYKDYTKYGFNVDNYADANKALCVIFVILIVIANVLLMIKYMTKGNVLFNPKSLTIISMAIGDVFLALFALTLKAEVFFKGFDSLSCGSLKSSWAYTNYLLNFVYGMGVVTLAAEIVYRRKTQGASKSKVYRLVSSLLFSSAPWVLGVVIILPLVLVNIDSVTCQSYQTKDQIKAQVMVSIMLPAIVAVLTCIVLKCQVPSKDLNAISTVLRRTLKFRTQNPAAQTSHKASSTNVNQDFQAAETSPPADDLKPRGIFAITRTGTETSAASQATQPTAPFQDMQPTAPTQALQPTAPTQNGHFPIHHYPQTQMDAHEPNFVLTDGQYAFHGQQPNENCSPPLAPPNTCYPVFVNPAFQPDNLDIKQPNTTFMVNAQIHDNSTHQRLQEGIDCQESQFHPTLHHPKGFNPLTHNPNIETFVPLSTSERTSEQYPFLNQHIQSSYNQDPAQQNGQQPPYFTSAQPNTQQPPYPMDLQRNSQQPPYPINLQPNTQQFSYPIVPQPNSQQPPHNTSAQPNTQQTPYPIIPQPNIQQPPYPIVPQLNTQQSPYPIVPQPNTQQPPYPIFHNQTSNNLHIP